jgi:curved DNA-binding protein CbpA
VTRIHSHYENLKVSRDAPLEVVRAAYRVLAQKYHPDINGSPDAPKIMAIINEAWRVLSDPALRQEHDAWLKAAEEDHEFSPGQAETGPASQPRSTAGEDTAADSSSSAAPRTGPRPKHSPTQSAHARTPQPSKVSNKAAIIALVAFVAFLTWLWKDEARQTQPSSSAPLQSKKVASEALPRNLIDSLYLGTLERPQIKFSKVSQQREYQAWFQFANEKLRSTLPAKERTDLLEGVWYESTRAGVDPSLTIAMVEKLSGFNAAATNSSGAIGFLQVGHEFRRQFSLADASALAPTRVNLRAGLTLFRYYLDSSKGNLVEALQKYRSQTQADDDQPTEAVTRLFATQVLEAKDNWRPFTPNPGDIAQKPAETRQPPLKFEPLTAKPEDRETGYLPGEPNLASGGRATFTIDNRSSAGNAIVRLYRDDRQPAVRSIYVRNGESFSMRNLAAGRYSLRYRFTDRKGTYKANQLFELIEEATEDGVRFSNLRVTLYTVENGNLSMKPVPDDEF